MGRSIQQQQQQREQQQHSTSSSLSNQSVEDNLPVFVFPNSLHFYCSDVSSLKQILTLYNPYDFTIKFKVLSTAPRKYNVIEPEGYIRPRSCLDITVRLLDASVNNVLKEDKFRVQMKREDKASIQGKRDVSVILLTTKEDKPEEKENTFEQLSPNHQPGFNGSSGSTFSLANYKIGDNLENVALTGRIGDRQPPSTSKPHPFYIFTAVICGLVLCLPSDERESRFPQYLYVTSTPKIIAAYILGLITSIICKYN